MERKHRRFLVIGLLLVSLVCISSLDSNSYFKRTVVRTISNVLSDQISSGVSEFVNSGSSNNSSSNKTSSSSSKNSSSNSYSSSNISSSSKYEPNDDLDFVYDGNVCVGVLVNGSLKEFDSNGNLKGVDSKLNEYIKNDLKKRNKKWSTPTVN